MKKIQQLKKQIAVAFLFILLGIMLVPVPKAKASDLILWDSYTKPSSRQKDRLFDNAELLSSAAQEDILAKLDELSQKHNSNIAILTVNEHSGPIQDYVDDYFDYNGFQADYDGAGVLFMLSMADREYAISTNGTGIQAFTDYGQEYLIEQMRPFLSEGDYYGAFNKYIEVADYFYTQYENGHPYDVDFKDTSPQALIKVGIICLGIGLIVALIPIFIMISSLKNVHASTTASGYQSHNGLHLTMHKDTYLRSSTSKVRIPDERSSSGGSGGSSVHISSSGSSHGGSHGHF